MHALVVARAGGDCHTGQSTDARSRFSRPAAGKRLRMGLSARRAAENESIFRDANERVEERLGELTLEEGRSPFLCECENLRCREMVRLTREEYESVRSRPNRFVVARGHPYTEASVVDETEQFQVIEKTGRAGEVAEELDPRSQRG